MPSRLWNKIDRSDPTACWPWPGTKDRDGYGRCQSEPGFRLAHRAMYAMVHGSIPEGLLIMHTCDNPPCVNPAHLVAGTNLENMADMVAKKRQGFGETHAGARLTEADVKAIRASSETLQVWADRLGVGVNTIHNARVGNTWKHIQASNQSLRGCKGVTHHFAKLTDEKARRIFHDTRKASEIAEEYGVSRKAVWQIRKGKMWKHIHQPAGRG